MKTMALAVLLSVALFSTVALAGDSARGAEQIDVSRKAEVEQPTSRTVSTEKSGISFIQAPAFQSSKADVSHLLSYQGTLTDPSGVALDTTVDMTFSIYTDSTGGSTIWTETQPAVAVNKGLFNVLLGRVNEISDTVFSDPVRWLGVQVGGDPELVPRQRIAAVGYALWASEADTAQFARNALGGSDGDWTIAGVDIYSAVSGNVGIGTDSPAAKLDVSGAVNIDSVYKIDGTTVLAVSDTQNTFVGLGAGASNTADRGTLVGYGAGYNNQGPWNTFLGRLAGYSNTEGGRNTFIGNEAGYFNTLGLRNTFVGDYAGQNNMTGDWNTFLGASAGSDNIEGGANTFIGWLSGPQNSTGNWNTFVGAFAGGYNDTGHENTYLGTFSGYNNEAGDGNVFLGYKAGWYETGSNKLYVANDQDSSSVLIYGDFATGRLGLGTLSPVERLDVAGTARVEGFKMPTGAADHYVLTSDASGVGSWQPAVNDSDWTVSGNHIYSAVPGSVGIGTTDPAAKLDVSGEINVDSVYQIENETVLSIGGLNNVFVGSEAGRNAIGGQLTFVGERAGKGNRGNYNTFIGAFAGQDSTTGSGNTFVGNVAGTWNTTGGANTFLGQAAGYDNTEGRANVYLGDHAGYDNVSGDWNTCLGACAGYHAQGDSNVFIGSKAGYDETGSNKLYIANGQDSSSVLIYGNFATGRLGLGTLSPAAKLDVVGDINAETVYKIGGETVFAVPDTDNVLVGPGAGEYNGGIYSTFIGKDAGRTNLGDFNTFLGTVAGYSNTTGQKNTFLGQGAGYSITTGVENTFLGQVTGMVNTTGSFNTFLGKSAGYSNATGDSNVFIGYRAGYNETGSGKLYIANGHDDSQVLIYGDFSTGQVGLGTTSPMVELDVNGAVNAELQYMIAGTAVLSTPSTNNVLVGTYAGLNNTGDHLTAVGDSAGYTNQGHSNTFIGANAGRNNVGGLGNSFLGYRAGYSNTTGQANTFLGTLAGNNNTDGGGNTFVGAEAGKYNITGEENTFVGLHAGFFNTTGFSNTFLGEDAGYDNTTGGTNTYIGKNAGYNNTIGGSNTFLGTNAGFLLSEGNQNTFLGKSSGYFNNGDGNVFIGYEAGSSETGSNKLYIANGSDTSDVLIYGDFSTGRVGLGTLDPQARLDVGGDVNTSTLYQIGGDAVLSAPLTNNVFVGKGAGENNTSNQGTFVGQDAGYQNQGGYNTFIGTESGYTNTTGNHNSFIGRRAGYSNTTGVRNVSIGSNAGRENDSGSNNVYVGYEAGRLNTAGANNVFLGHQAGYNETGSNRLYVDVNNTPSPLIWGDFSNDRLVVDGNESHNTNNRTLFVNGSAGGTTDWYNDSDRRLKKNIATIPGALDKVRQLRGVNFEWKDEERHEPGRQMGFIAQEAVEVIPEVVSGQDGHYAMQYGPITALLVEAVKELKAENEMLKQRVAALETATR